MISRRQFLTYVGAAATMPAWMGRAVDPAVEASKPRWPAGSVPFPSPLPGDHGPDLASRLAQFIIRDALVLPEGYAFDLLAVWGDRFGTKERSIRFGFNCDYVGIVRRRGTRDEFWVLVNHEYISARSWLEGFPQLSGETVPDVGMLYDGPVPRLRLDDKVLPGPSLACSAAPP